MHAIPTIYAGTQYRSRLEARWAAFFDLVGWRFEYEPCDFKGWIPDFVLLGKRPVHVEVKPVYEFPADIAGEIDRSGCRSEVLIVGASIPLWTEEPIHWEEFGIDPTGRPTTSKTGPWLGWLREDYPDGEHESVSWWRQAAPGFWNVAPGHLDFCHSEGGYWGRMYGGYDGGSFGGAGGDVEDYIAKKWTAAKNLTQWRPNHV